MNHSRLHRTLLLAAVLAIGFLVIVVAPISVSAQSPGTTINYNAQIKIPGSSESARYLAGNNPVTDNLFGQWVDTVYRFCMWLAITLAIFMMMVGGFLWVIAGGSPQRVENAKSYITSAITGLVLALTSFLLLQTVNPQLVVFKPITPKTPTGLADSGCCCFQGLYDKRVIRACSPDKCENMVCEKMAGMGKFVGGVHGIEHFLGCTNPVFLSKAVHKQWPKTMSQFEYYGSCQGDNITPQTTIELGGFNRSCCAVNDNKTDVLGISDTAARLFGRQICYIIPSGDEWDDCKKYLYSWYDLRAWTQFGYTLQVYPGTCQEAMRGSGTAWLCDAGIVTGLK